MASVPVSISCFMALATGSQSPSSAIWGPFLQSLVSIPPMHRDHFLTQDFLRLRPLTNATRNSHETHVNGAAKSPFPADGCPEMWYWYVCGTQ